MAAPDDRVRLPSQKWRAGGAESPPQHTNTGHGSADISCFTFGTPMPVTMSYPALALNAPLLPAVMSRKLLPPSNG